MNFRNRVSSDQLVEIRSNLFSKVHSLNAIRERQQKFGISNQSGSDMSLIQSVALAIVNVFRKSCKN
jgi:hypothetical protein